MSDDSDSKFGSEYQQDVFLNKPGIVGARWWHQGLVASDRQMSRRQALVGIAMAGGAVAAVVTLGAGFASLFSDPPEPTSIVEREALPMQKTYGWDFGARGVSLVFDGVAEGPFVRAQLANLPAVMTPVPGTFAKYHIPTLVESLLAAPTTALPDPGDGLAHPDATPFKRLADVIVPIATTGMQQAYGAGAALARLAYGHPGLAVLADLSGPLAVAFAAGAASLFEPILLLDNWPHPHGVVPSHQTLAAMAYYQPRFASQKARRNPPPLFVLDRARLTPYTEAGNKFDNRYYARIPTLAALAKDGVRTLLYVVAAPAALPEADDLNPILAAEQTSPWIELRTVALTDFTTDGTGRDPNLYYGGSGASEDAFWAPGGATNAGTAATRSHKFVSRRLGPAPPPIARIPVVVTASGLVLAAALDRRGSMNRFSGGWSG